jgi:hypothetical protein
MVRKTIGAPSAEQVAKAERRRLEKEDGARAIQEVAANAVTVRKNMTRLRELRLAQQAQERVSRPQMKARPRRRS